MTKGYLDGISEVTEKVSNHSKVIDEVVKRVNQSLNATVDAAVREGMENVTFLLNSTTSTAATTTTTTTTTTEPPLKLDPEIGIYNFFNERAWWPFVAMIWALVLLFLGAAAVCCCRCKCRFMGVDMAIRGEIPVQEIDPEELGTRLDELSADRIEHVYEELCARSAATYEPAEDGMPDPPVEEAHEETPDKEIE